MLRILRDGATPQEVQFVDGLRTMLTALSLPVGLHWDDGPEAMDWYLTQMEARGPKGKRLARELRAVLAKQGAVKAPPARKP